MSARPRSRAVARLLLISGLLLAVLAVAVERAGETPRSRPPKHHGEPAASPQAGHTRTAAPTVALAPKSATPGHPGRPAGASPTKAPTRTPVEHLSPTPMEPLTPTPGKHLTPTPGRHPTPRPGRHLTPTPAAKDMGRGSAGQPTHASPAMPLKPRVALVSKVLGSDAGPGALQLQKTLGNVAAADLGAPAFYRNKWYLAFGDAIYSLPLEPDSQNFLVATAKFAPGSAMTLTGFISMHVFGSGLSAPIRAIRPDPGYTIPAALFTVHYRGESGLFAEYVLGGDVGGFGHWSLRTQLARLDDHDQVFRPYKPATYVWQRQDGRPLQYDFGQSSFWQDSTYIYMAGTTSNRFGGLKLARIPLSQFMSPANTSGWQYYLGYNRWSTPTVDEQAIAGRVPWLIPPTDPAFSYDRNSLASGCNGLSIGEFSIVWDAYLARFLLLTGTDGCTQRGQVRVYTAPSLKGPWTRKAVQVAMPHPEWDYYAPYSGPDLVTNGGRTLYFLASTYKRYGVYLYRMDF